MTDLEDKNEWKNCIDITGVRLPTGYYFGASAGTGDLSGECERMLWAVSSPPSPQAFLSLPSCDCWCAQAVGWPLHLVSWQEENLGLGVAA